MLYAICDIWMWYFLMFLLLFYLTMYNEIHINLCELLSTCDNIMVSQLVIVLEVHITNI